MRMRARPPPPKRVSRELADPASAELTTGSALAGGRSFDKRSLDELQRLRVLVEVADTGLGFTKSAGGGTGLANLRARLAGHFGGAASLSLALNSPRGLIATIVLPYKDAAANRGSA